MVCKQTTYGLRVCVCVVENVYYSDSRQSQVAVYNRCCDYAEEHDRDKTYQEQSYYCTALNVIFITLYSQLYGICTRVTVRKCIK